MSEPEIDIITPLDGLETVQNDLVVGWTDTSANHTHFIVWLENAGVVIKVLNTSDSYVNIHGLSPGAYNLSVHVADGPEIIGSSAKTKVIVHAIPGFSVTHDLTEYDTSGIIIFRIEAPLGSSLGIHAESSEDHFSYNPKSLSTSEFRTFLKPGTYRLTANLTYYDYTTEYANTFSIGVLAPGITQQKATAVNSTNASLKKDENALYSWSLTTVGPDKEPLPSVGITYRMLGKNNTFPHNGTSATDKDGKKKFLLKPGSYLVDFYKEGYQPLTRLIELDYENVTQVLKFQPQPNKTLLSELFAPNITITSPQGGSKVKGPMVTVDYLVDGSPEKCQMLLSQGAGWEVKGEGAPVKGENTFIIQAPSAATYTAKIRCFAKEKESQSRDISFSVFIPVRDDSIAAPILERIDLAKKKVSTLEADQRKIIEPLSGEIKQAEDEIVRLNDAYNKALLEGAAESEIDAARKALSGKIPLLEGGIPLDITVTEADNKALYLPVTGFEDVFGEYLLASGKEATKSAVKKAKDAQEDFMARMEMKEIRVVRIDGQDETYISVDESITSFNPGEGFDLIVSIDDALAREAVRFITPAKKVNDRFYEIHMDGSGTVSYVFSENIPLGSAQEVKTLILVSSNATGTEATGFSVFEQGIGSSNIIYYIIITLALTAGVSGLMMYYSPSRVMKKKADRVARGIDKVMDHIENGRAGQAFALLPRVVKDHQSLSRVYQEDLNPIMQHIHRELEGNNLQSMITKMESMLRQLGDSYDQKVYDEFIRLYDSMITTYNNADEALKARHYGKVDQMYQIVNELEHTAK